MKLLNVSFGDKIAVAVSGGKDSMCLLHSLLNKKQQLNLEIIAVNVEHNIRGKDSVSDSLFVKNYCEKVGVFLYQKSVDAPLYSKQNKLPLEEGARILRYGVFKDVLTEFKGFKIATAHHKNDLLESVLFNLFRGTGLKGLKGIEKATETIVRPLINVSREEIDEYAKLNDVPYVVDQTNYDVEYSRNYLRHKIIPHILEKFPHSLDSVYRLSETVEECEDFIKISAEKCVFLYKGNYAVSIDCHPAIFKRAVIIALKNSGVIKDYEKIHVDSVYNLSKQNNGDEVSLPSNITAVKVYDKIVFYKTKNTKTQKETPFCVGEFAFGDAVAVIQQTNSFAPSNYLTFDGDKIPNDAVIRARKNGDVFTKFGGGTKKLKDYFIDKKIPVKERDLIPVIASGNEVLVIFGLEISENVKITEKTTNFCIAYLK